MDSYNEYMPEVTWAAFEYINNNVSKEFEGMCRWLFADFYAEEGAILQSASNNPGIEVTPVLERLRVNEKHQRRISFQSKFFSSTVKYNDIKDSAEETVKYFKGQLDLVYLFCNKPINTSTKVFGEIKRILKDGGIEIEIIADEFLLDKVRQNRSIANYYFRQRQKYLKVEQPYSDRIISGSDISCEHSDLNVEYLTKTKFASEFILDKINTIRDKIIYLDFKSVQEELDELLAQDPDGIEQKYVLYFYGFLLAIRFGDKEKINYYYELSGNEYLRDIDFLINFWESPYDVKFAEFVILLPETQSILINKIFMTQQWDCIINLNKRAEEIADSVNEKVVDLLKFYCALCYINKGEIYQGYNMLEEIQEYYSSSRLSFFLICAKIMVSNKALQKGDMNQVDVLPSLLNDLSYVKLEVPDIVKQSEIFVASIEVQSYCFLAQYNSDFIQNAYACYDTYSDKAKNDGNVKFYMALCREFEGDFDSALDIYSSFNWEVEETPAIRRMLCLIQKGEPDKVVEDFKKIAPENLTLHLEAIYLYAVSLIDNERYSDELSETLLKYKESNTNPFFIAFYAKDKKTFEEIIVPYFKFWLSKEGNLKSLKVNDRALCIMIFAKFDQITLVNMFLESIDDLNVIGSAIAYEVYSSLFRALKQNFEGKIFREEVRNFLNCIEKIA